MGEAMSRVWAVVGAAVSGREAPSQTSGLVTACRGTIAILLLGGWLVPTQSHAQTPGVTISSPVAAEGHRTAQPVEGSSTSYNYCAHLNAAPSDDVVITATPSPPIVDIDPITFTPGNWSEKQCFDVFPAASADNGIDEPDRVVNISHKVTSSDPEYGNSPSGGQYVVKLRDDDKTLVYVKPADPGPIGPITEGNPDEKIEFVVSLGRPLVAGEVAVAILGIGPWVIGALGEGLKTDDYTMALKSCQGCRLQDANQPYSFVIFSGAGAQSATLEITANDDVISEGTEKISVGSGLQWQYDNLCCLTNVGGGVGPAEPFKVLSTNILDTDGDTPNVRLLPKRRHTQVGEGKPAVLTVKLSEPLDQSAEFTVKTLRGDAEPGVDYESGPWTVTIPAGATSKSFTIRTISDSKYEGSQEWGPELARESFRVWLPLDHLPAGVSAAIPYDHRIHILDDDVPVIKKPWCVSVELYQTVEGYIRSSQKNGMKQGVAEWTAVRNAFDEQGTFSAAQAREKEKRSSDWKPVAEALECMETPIPDSELSLSAGSAVHEGGNAEFTITADPAPVAGLTVNVTVGQTGDYLDAPGAGRRTVTFAAGATTATLAVATLDDDTDEPDGSVGVTLDAGTGYTVAAGQAGGSVAVSDDDPWSVVSIAGGSAVTEGGTARFTLTATPAPQGTLTVNVNIADSGAFASSGEDGARQVTIGTTGTATLDVATDNDDTDEPDGAIGVAVFSGRGYTPSDTHGAISIAVSDDDDSTTKVAVAEDDTTPAACVSDALLADVQGYAGETWRASPDHVERWSQVLAAFGESNSYSNNPMTASEAQTYADRGLPRWVPVVTALECLEGAPPPALPAVSIAAGAGITEGGDAVFTVSASPAPAASLTVSLTVADDTNSDFLAQSDEGTRTVTIAGGQTSATLTLTTQDDSTDEADGSITATVQAGTGYTVGTQSTGTAAVSDDDPAPTPVVGIADGSAVTEGGTASFTLTATPAPLGTLTVNVNVVDSGAFASSGESGAKTVTIDTTGSATLDVATDNDDTDEPDGTLGATIASGQGYTPSGTHGSASIAVRDDDASTACVSDALLADVQGYAGENRPNSPDHVERWSRVLAAFGESNGYSHNPMTASEAQTYADRGLPRWVPVVTALECLEGAPPPALPAISITGGSAVTEGGDAVFTVSASPAPTSSLTVSLTVADDGTSDFLAQSDEGTQTVTIAGGQTSATLTVPTQDDSTDETDGSVTATVTGGSAYTVGTPSTGTVAVSDDDATPSATPIVSIAASGDVTEGAAAQFTLTASPVPTATITVDVAVTQSGDFATSGQTGARTVTIGSSGTATLTVATDNDSTDEANGSVTATVTGGTGYTVGTPSTGTVAVSDDDATPSATPIVSIAAGGDVTEGAAAQFTLTASPAPTATITVDVAVAQSGDFATSGQTGARIVTIGSSGTATLTVATDNDTADEADGSVTATVQTGTGYTPHGTHTAATVAVADDDAPVVSVAAGGGVTEGISASFTVTTNPAPAAPLDVALTVGQSGDFAASGETGARTVTVPTSGSVTFEVATDDDAGDEPDGSVTATVDAGTGYTVAAAPDNAATVAVSDNDATAAASGPTISIADAAFKESQRSGYFKVTLSEKVAWPVTVRYATRDSTPVSAVAGEDYLAWKRSWRVWARFRPGETETQIYVHLYNDSHDEDAETFELELFDAGVNGPPGVSVSIADGVAVGTITNSDPMPAAWLSRFGRTVAEQALDGIAGRMAAPRRAGVEGTLAGRALTFGGAGPDGSGSVAPGAASHTAALGAAGFPGPGLRTGSGADRLVSSETAGRSERGTPAFGTTSERFGIGSGGEADPYGPGASRTLTLGDALLGSSFTATGAEDASGGSLALWGRAAHSSFDGREGTFSLDGEATTALLGADYARERWLLGLALMQSEGDGGYADRGTGPQVCPDDIPSDMRALCNGAVREGDGAVEASLTAAVPYAALQASERMKFWGAFGHGSGEVTLKPRAGGALASDISWTMASTGLRSDLLAPPGEEAGLSLALVSDALWARTSSEKTSDLAASESDVTRLRLGLEGRWAHLLEDGGHFTPKLELGARHDGGDAETGAGVELGGGLAWSVPALGLNLDLSGRTLLAHGDGDLEDRGFAASMAFDPDPASERGASFHVRQDWGGQAAGGLDALFASDPLDRHAASGAGGAAESRWTAEAAWGLPAFSGRFTGSPHAGVGLSTGARDYTLGWRLAPAAGAHVFDVTFGVTATRRESDGMAPEHRTGFEATARW